MKSKKSKSRWSRPHTSTSAVRRGLATAPARFETLENRVMLTASPYTTAAFTALPGKPDIIATADSAGGNGGADLNGDNLADLVVKYPVAADGNTPAKTVVAALLGQSNGTFSTNNIVVSYDNPQVLNTVSGAFDFNGDSKPDLVIIHSDGAGAATHHLDVYLSNASGSYAKTAQSFDLGNGSSAPLLNVFDMNADGKLDLVLEDLASFIAPKIVVLLGSGGGSFQNPVSTTFPQAPAAFMQDLSGDGITDVVTNGFDETFTNQVLSVYKGNANGTYSLAPTFTDSTSHYTFGGLFQLTSDNLPEILAYHAADFSDPNSPSTVTILRNNGDASYATSYTQTLDGGFISAVGSASAIVSGGSDLDHDGDNDLILTEGGFTGTEPWTVHVEKNDGNAVFADVQQITLPTPATAGTPSFPLALDVDHDGFLDISFSAITGVGPRSQVGVYFNRANGSLTSNTFITPAVVASPSIPFSYGSVAILNDDLKFDALFTRANNTGGPTADDPVYAFVNTTGRAFTNEVVTQLGSGTQPDALATDLDGDGNADLIVYQDLPLNVTPVETDAFRFYAGGGDGTFAGATGTVSFGAGNDVATHLHLLSFDNNASTDLLFIGDNPTGLYVSINGSSGTPADGAGNSTASARNIGALSAEQTFHDAVNPGDTDDFYKFTLAQAGTVHLLLSGLSANADLKLLDSTGAPIANGSLGGSVNETISHDTPAGTYYIRVFNVGGSTTNYTLAASVLAATPTIEVTQDANTITSGQASAVDFGAAAPAQPTLLQRVFTVHNSGASALTLGLPQPPAGFVVLDNQLPASLAPGGTATFTIGMSTGALGVFSGNVVLSNNSGNANNDFAIPLAGRVEFPTTLIHTFTTASNDAAIPVGGLTALGSTFYASSSAGAAHGDGAVFTLIPTGSSLFPLHSFAGGPADGNASNGALLSVFSFGNGFSLFGETASGGTFEQGTIFSAKADGSTYQIVHHFGSVANDGAQPLALTQVLDINNTFAPPILFGVTSAGGTSNNGILYSMNTDGSSYTILHRFTGGADDGSVPAGSLVLFGSTLYGVTQAGGANGEGTIFSIGKDGTGYTVLHDFDSGAGEGANPSDGLTFANSKLVGLTATGTLYSFDPANSNFTVLHTFAGGTTDGAQPAGKLTLVDSTLYGQTLHGGAADKGTLFSINADGTGYALLHSFTGGANDGEQPTGQLLSFNGSLYGLTTSGGAASKGVYYSVTPVALPSGPQMVVSSGGEVIPAGSTTPINFGAAQTGDAAVTRTFTVTNTGNATLTLDTPQVPLGFEITEPLISGLAPGASDTFTIALKTNEAGNFVGDLSIGSNSGGSQGSFSFPISGSVSSEPRPDLAGQITAVNVGRNPLTPSSTLVPGDTLGVNLTILNSGAADLVASSMQVRFYLSADATLDTATDVALDPITLNRPRIAHGFAATYSIQVDVPQVPLSGTYFLLAQIDSASQITESDESNNTAASAFAAQVVLEAGNVGGRNVKLTFTEADGTVDTFGVAGPGNLRLVPGDGFFDLVLTGTAANSNITIATKKDKTNPADDGIITLRNVTVGDAQPLSLVNSLQVSRVQTFAALDDATPAPLGKFVAKTARLIGAFEAPAGLKTLTLDSAGDQASVHIGAPAVADPKASVVLAVNLLKDVSITSDIPIKSFTAIEWQDSRDDAGNPTPDDPADLLSAPAIGAVSIKGNKSFALDGDFEADLTTTGVAGAAASAVSLGAVKVAGNLRGSAWNIAGNAAGLTVARDTDGLTLTTTSGGDLKTLKLGTVSSATLNLAGDAGAVTSINWLDGTIHAATARSIAIKGDKLHAGDFNADVTLAGDPAAKTVLGSLSVAGVARAVVKVAGNSGAVTVGGAEGSKFLVGVTSEADPASAADFANFTLASFTVKGVKNLATPFVSTLIAAKTIGKATLKDVTTASTADFGLLADLIKSYSRTTTGAPTVKLSNLDDPALLTPPGEADRHEQFVVKVV